MLYNLLQRCRSASAAESANRTRSPGEYSLQRCRSASAAERAVIAIIGGVIGASTVPQRKRCGKADEAGAGRVRDALQRCRSASAAERPRRSPRAIAPPRFNGAAAQALRKVEVTPTGREFIGASTVPQRKRCGKKCPRAARNGRGRASTVPQRKRCGKGINSTRGATWCPGFNGAAAQALRKGRRQGPAHRAVHASTVPQRKRCGKSPGPARQLRRWSRFNGAAAQALRKDPDTGALILKKVLQRCRSASAAERPAPAAWALLPATDASTVPQRKRCGKGSFPADRVPAVCASTVPQRKRCGKVPLPVSSTSWPRSFNGAAAQALRKAA